MYDKGENDEQIQYVNGLATDYINYYTYTEKKVNRKNKEF